MRRLSARHPRGARSVALRASGMCGGGGAFSRVRGGWGFQSGARHASVVVELGDAPKLAAASLADRLEQPNLCAKKKDMAQAHMWSGFGSRAAASIDAAAARTVCASVAGVAAASIPFLGAFFSLHPALPRHLHLATRVVSPSLDMSSRG